MSKQKNQIGVGRAAMHIHEQVKIKATTGSPVRHFIFHRRHRRRCWWERLLCPQLSKRTCGAPTSAKSARRAAQAAQPRPVLHLHLQCTVGGGRAPPRTVGCKRGPKKEIEIGDPRGGLVGLSTKKDQGQIYFPDIFLIVFLNSPHRETPKKVQKREKKKSRKSRFWIFGRTFCKNFSTRFFCKTFFVVFLNSHR
jgi:hypothetical protein